MPVLQPMGSAAIRRLLAKPGSFDPKIENYPSGDICRWIGADHGPEVAGRAEVPPSVREDHS